MYPNPSKQIEDTFFQPYYAGRVEKMKQLGDNLKGTIDTALTLFWFSVIDFYGGLYWVGKNDDLRKGGIAHPDGFKLFIEDFFPEAYKRYGDLIYTIFRSGMIHQVSPKKAGIHWNADYRELIWFELDVNLVDESGKKITANLEDKVAHLNLCELHENTYKAYKDFRELLSQPAGKVIAANIQRHLLFNPDKAEDIKDGLGDGLELHIQWKKLNGAAPTIENSVPKTIAKRKYMKNYNKDEFATLVVKLKELQTEIDTLELEAQSLSSQRFPQKQRNPTTGEKEYPIQEWEAIIAIIEKKDEFDAITNKLKDLNKSKDFLKARISEQLPQTVYGRPIQIQGVLSEGKTPYNEVVTIISKTEIQIGTIKY